MSRKLSFMSLFSGGGGLSEGFIRAGFHPIAHVESDRSSCYTLLTRMAYHWMKEQRRETQYSDYLNGRLTRPEFYALIPERITNSVINTTIAKESLPEIFKQVDTVLDSQKLDLIIGGPPCQAYSLVGRSRDQNRMKGDPRNYLYSYYADFLRKYNPAYFVFENVTGLLSARDTDDRLYFDAMKDLFRNHGYETEYKILSAENYGVLQRRKRIILVGRKGNSTGFYPEPDEWDPGVQVREIFSDLPAINAGEGNTGPCRIGSYDGTWQYEAGIRNGEIPVTWHQARPNTEQDLEIYRTAVHLWNREKKRLNYNSLPERLKSHKHRASFLDRFKVVAEDIPFSHTVVAHIAKDGHYYIHPDINQNRSITPREAARLQTFPDNYYFEGFNSIPGRTSVFRQIGNAVPVLLARKIAEKLKERWM